MLTTVTLFCDDLTCWCKRCIAVSAFNRLPLVQWRRPAHFFLIHSSLRPSPPPPPPPQLRRFESVLLLVQRDTCIWVDWELPCTIIFSPKSMKELFSWEWKTRIRRESFPEPWKLWSKVENVWTSVIIGKWRNFRNLPWSQLDSFIFDSLTFLVLVKKWQISNGLESR